MPRLQVRHGRQSNASFELALGVVGQEPIGEYTTRENPAACTCARAASMGGSVHRPPRV